MLQIWQDKFRRQLEETDTPIKELIYRFNFPTQSFFGKYVRHNR